MHRVRGITLTLRTRIATRAVSFPTNKYIDRATLHTARGVSWCNRISDCIPKTLDIQNWLAKVIFAGQIEGLPAAVVWYFHPDILDLLPTVSHLYYSCALMVPVLHR